jgi:hypothetical protein
MSRLSSLKAAAIATLLLGLAALVTMPYAAEAGPSYCGFHSPYPECN